MKAGCLKLLLATKHLLMKHRVALLLLLAYIVLAMIFWFPLSIHLGSRVVDHPMGDDAFNIWILGWGNRALTHFPWRFFEAPMFYPYPHVLAWGDNLFAVTLVTLPLVPIFGLLATYNLVLLGSTALCGFSLYLLVNYLTRNKAAAFLAGALWVISYARTAQGYIQIITLWWLPLIFLFAEKLRHGGRKRYFVLLTAALFLQMTTGIYVALYTVLTFGAYVLMLALFRQLSKRVFLRYVKALLIAGVLAAPVFAPSIILDYLHPTVRGLSQQVGLQWQDINPLRIPGRLWYDIAAHFGWTSTQPVAQFSIGLVLSGLVIAGIVYFAWRLWRKSVSKKELVLPATFLLIGVYGILAAFGPYIGTSPGKRIDNLAFLIPYRLVPGFKVMRLTLRWQFIGMFGLSAFAGYVLARIFTKWKLWMQIGFVIIAIGWLVIEQVAWNQVGLYPAPTLKQYPVYGWIKQQPGNFAIAELPIFDGVYYPPNDAIEGRRTYLQTLYWHPRASGAFSPFIPAGYPARAGLIDSLGDNNQAIAYLRKYNIKYVLVLPDDYATLGWGANGGAIEEKKLNGLPYLKKVFSSPNGVAYEVLPD
jgi:hypothetical protein